MWSMAEISVKRFEVDVYVSVYIHYKGAWKAVLREKVQCAQKPGNISDSYTMAVYK